MPLINLPDFAEDLLSEFDARKTTRVDTPVIQPAEPFLDMAGEDLRRRIFMTESETGASRPQANRTDALSVVRIGVVEQR